MAHADWKRYYAPILVHKETGACRIWAGKLFRTRYKAQRKGWDINLCERANYSCIGIAAIRGNARNASLQVYLNDNSR